MSSPTIEARARAISRVGNGLPNVSLGWMAELCADEALKPIRQLHQPEDAGTPTGEYAMKCGTCPEYWPCSTALLIYTTEELAP